MLCTVGSVRVLVRGERASSFSNPTPFVDVSSLFILQRPRTIHSSQFCFQFNREGTHKTLEKELVVMLLKLVLQDNRVPADRVDSFCNFLESHKDYGRITLDQWTSFWDFSQECEDLSAYDEATSAWPVLIDEYVEYMEELQKKG